MSFTVTLLAILFRGLCLNNKNQYIFPLSFVKLKQNIGVFCLCALYLEKSFLNMIYGITVMYLYTWSPKLTNSLFGLGFSMIIEAFSLSSTSSMILLRLWCKRDFSYSLSTILTKLFLTGILAAFDIETLGPVLETDIISEIASLEF